MPCSSMRRWKAANLAVSARLAESQSVTGWSVKNQVNMDPTRFTVMPAGCAALIGRPAGPYAAHDTGTPAVSADGQSAADDLAQRGHIRPDAEARLRAPIGHAEAGHHFIQDQQRAVPRSDLA